MAWKRRNLLKRLRFRVVRQVRIRWGQLARWWTARKVAILILVVGLLIGAGGNFFTGNDMREFINDFYPNASTELISIAITVLIINALYERRDIEREKETLIMQMRSPENAFAIEAVRQLRSRGWLKDGSLQRANLDGANLYGVNLHKANLEDAYLIGANLGHAHMKGANLVGADLNAANLGRAELAKSNLAFCWMDGALLIGADLSNANLEHCTLSKANLEEANLSGAILAEADLNGAEITVRQLVQVQQMRGAIMPNGSRYDGRFNLRGDTDLANKLKVDINDPKAMADFYGASLEGFSAG